MFYRFILLVLVAATLLVTQLDSSPVTSWTNSENSDRSSVQEPVVWSSVSEERNTAPVVDFAQTPVADSISTPVADFIPTPVADSCPTPVADCCPTPVMEDATEVPQLLAPMQVSAELPKQDHSMLQQASSTSPILPQSNSVLAPSPTSLNLELPVSGLGEANTVLVQPTNNLQQAFSNSPHSPQQSFSNLPANFNNPQQPFSGSPANFNNQYQSYPAAQQHVSQGANRYDPRVIYHTDHQTDFASGYSLAPSHPALNTQNYTLLQYRRIMRSHPTPTPQELQGTWRGINKGIATLAIDKRFLKEFKFVDGQIYGDNIEVEPKVGIWDPVDVPQTGDFKRVGKFLVQPPRGIGAFKHAAILNYRKGGNKNLDPSKLIFDRVVKLDDNHMLGRATAKFGLVEIPLSYFVLQRVPDHNQTQTQAQIQTQIHAGCSECRAHGSSW